MEEGRWNNSSGAFSNFSVFLITTAPLPSEDAADGPRNRLLLLSHQLAKRQIPAFCLKRSPKYSEVSVDGECVVGFDIHNKFDKFALISCFSCTKWLFKQGDPISFEFLDDLQKAQNLYLSYKLSSFSPIYFWTFLYFEINDSPDGDFLYQNIPLHTNDGVIIRRFSTSKLQSFLTKKGRLKPKTLVLLPPYEHPFYVESLSSTHASLVSISKQVMVVENKDLTFVTLMSFPKCIFGLDESKNPETAAIAQAKASTTSKAIQVKTSKVHLNFFHNVEESIEDFFSRQSLDEVKEEAPVLDSEEIVTFGALTPVDLIDEMVTELEDRKIIRRILSQNPKYPDCSPILRLSSISFFSPLSTDIGFPSPPPVLAFLLSHSAHFSGRHTGIPECLVNCKGYLLKIPANIVYSKWQESCFSPINGRKNALFYVFIVGSPDTNPAKLFFKELQNIYCSLGLGNLSPISNDAFVTTTEFDLENDIAKRIHHPDFMDQQPMIFVVHPLIFDTNLKIHLVITFILDSFIGCSGVDVMRSLALLVYTRIREMNTTPFGKLFLGPDQLMSLFFGFRFSSPIVLERHLPGDSIRIHIAWDPLTCISSWTDDSGQSFHMNKPMDADGIRQTFGTIRAQLPDTNVGVVMTVVAEGLDEDHYNGFMQEDFSDIVDFTLISVFPAPATQAEFHSHFDDDVVVIAPNERQFDPPANGYLAPLSSCFVIPHQLPPYQVSIFAHQKDDDQAALFEISQELSFMSWISSSFSPEKRTSAIPAHIRALLRRTKKPSLSIGRFEFLPPRTV